MQVLNILQDIDNNFLRFREYIDSTRKHSNRLKKHEVAMRIIYQDTAPVSFPPTQNQEEVALSHHLYQINKLWIGSFCRIYSFLPKSNILLAKSTPRTRRQQESTRAPMELELGLKITRNRDDLTSGRRLTKVCTGPLFFCTETDKMFILAAYLKGIKKESIEIHINEEGTQIAISGEKNIQAMVRLRSTMHNKEADVMGFRKIFQIPDGVILDHIKAEFIDEDSILTIYIPKSIRGLQGIDIEEVKEDDAVDAEQSVTTATAGDEVPRRELEEMKPENGKNSDQTFGHKEEPEEVKEEPEEVKEEPEVVTVNNPLRIEQSLLPENAEHPIAMGPQKQNEIPKPKEFKSKRELGVTDRPDKIPTQDTSCEEQLLKTEGPEDWLEQPENNCENPVEEIVTTELQEYSPNPDTLKAAENELDKIIQIPQTPAPPPTQEDQGEESSTEESIEVETREQEDQGEESSTEESIEVQTSERVLEEHDHVDTFTESQGVLSNIPDQQDGNHKPPKRVEIHDAQHGIQEKKATEIILEKDYQIEVLHPGFAAATSVDDKESSEAEERSFSHRSTQTEEPPAERPLTHTACIFGRSAFLVSLVVLVIHFFRDRRR